MTLIDEDICGRWLALCRMQNTDIGLAKAIVKYIPGAVAGQGFKVDPTCQLSSAR